MCGVDVLTLINGCEYGTFLVPPDAFIPSKLG